MQKLPISIHLKGPDFNEWSKNVNGIQEKFSSALCQAFLIPNGSILIIKVDRGSIIISGQVKPPYGKSIIDSLNGTALDSPARIKAVRECCSRFGGTIESITIGEFNLSIGHKLMDPLWNRKYLWAKSDTEKGQYWEKPIDRGGKPYFCPSGL